MIPTIIVFEQDLITSNVIKKNLEEEQETFNVINVINVNQAIKVIEEFIPDLVLINIDIHSQEDGIYLGNYLLKRRNIPYVYISSFLDKHNLERIKETFPQGFIAKPFKKLELLATIKIAINNYKFLNSKDFISNSETSEIPFVIKKIIGYIDANINNKIAINDLASRSRWKKKHFIKVFTKYMGVTPYQFVLSKKIEKAKILMTESDISPFDIAFELGFMSYTNFSNAFKKATGKTPSNFRLNYGPALVN